MVLKNSNRRLNLRIQGVKGIIWIYTYSLKYLGKRTKEDL